MKRRSSSTSPVRVCPANRDHLTLPTRPVRGAMLIVRKTTQCVGVVEVGNRFRSMTRSRHDAPSADARSDRRTLKRIG